VRLLLDTPVVLWLHADRAQLPAGALDAMSNGWLASRLQASDIASLPIALSHVLTGAALPPHHRDPFDRLLVAQAQVEGLTLVTGDPALRAYDVDILWD
jgi:PIN domain nuclease of toxin-antitoxin system